MKRYAECLRRLAALLLVVSGVQLPAAPRPNILFVFCDDLTTQAMSCYGDARKTQGAGNVLKK